MTKQGAYTACDLQNAACLQKTKGKTRPETLKMALELSRLAYDMEIAPFLDTGWTDASFQVDDLLLTDFKSRKACEQGAQKARSRMERLDPISQYRGFKRQKEEIDTCKAVVMAHPMENGRYCIAIVFTGTTRRLYEWLSNLRVEEEEGFHAGFLKLTRLFEENASRILFPDIARATGLLKLSLEDILAQMRRGSDRYSLFVTGHSQGAALTQIYVYRLMQSGVPSQWVQGVGFASPSVSLQRSVHLAADYPVINIINADDAVARIGGRMHIGMCHVLPVTQAFRRACYGQRADEPIMADMLQLCNTIRSTEEALLFGIALTDAVRTMPESESEEIFASVLRGLLPDILLQHLTGYAQRAAQSLGRRLRAKCEKVAGMIREDKLQSLRGELDALNLQYGSRAVVAMIFEVMLRPHALADKQQQKAYQAIVTEFDKQLVSCMWVYTQQPIWDQRFEGERKDRERRVYDRFHSLSSQRRQNREDT